MLTEIQQKILKAISQAVRPIASIFLSCGLGYVHFEEVFKAAFILVAAEKFGLRGRKTNTSRIAVMTGLTRKEVARLRKVSLPEDLDWVAVNIIPGKVLRAWTTETNYTQLDGEPKELPYSGGERSFCSLVSKVGGDLPAGAIKAELKRIGAVVESQDGVLRLIKREFVPDGIDEGLPAALMDGLANIGSTIAYNSNPRRRGDAFFQRIVDSAHIAPSKHADLERFAKIQLAEFGEKYSEDLKEVAEQQTDSGQKKVNAGVGVYFFSNSSSD
jgi:hypothetical protein